MMNSSMIARMIELDDVQQMSLFALTAADEFTWQSVAAPGCSFLNARGASGVIISAMGHFASGFGLSTSLSGLRTAADSAMKSTKNMFDRGPADLIYMSYSFAVCE